jgi:hypothetical protein
MVPIDDGDCEEQGFRLQFELKMHVYNPIQQDGTHLLGEFRLE